MSDEKAVYTIHYDGDKAFIMKDGKIYKQILAEPPSVKSLAKRYPAGTIDATSTMEIEQLFPIGDVAETGEE